MFDTMTVTKAGGALCGAFLIFLLGKWAAESLYNTEPASHGGEEVAQAYSIDTGAEGGVIRPVVDRVIAEWLAAHGRQAIPLVVACFWLDRGWSQWLSMSLFVAAGITGSAMGVVRAWLEREPRPSVETAAGWLWKVLLGPRGAWTSAGRAPAAEWL